MIDPLQNTEANDKTIGGKIFIETMLKQIRSQNSLDNVCQNSTDLNFQDRAKRSSFLEVFYFWCFNNPVPLAVRYLRIWLAAVTKNILMQGKYSFIHQKGVVFGKKLLKREFQIS